MPDKHHILSAQQGAIDTLRADFKRMGEAALANARNAAQGLLQRDTDMCNRAIADDEEVDALEKLIDHEGVELILKFSPMGRDLRRIISTMKAATAVERISDHAVSLAKRAKRINTHSPVVETEGLFELAELAIAQFRDALAAYNDGDLEAAVAIPGRDDQIDVVYRKFNERVIAVMQTDLPHIPDYVDLLFCARFIERIGDQAVNIAEDAIYMLTAKDIRHGGE
jgi:phosphate transport system protein